MSEWLGYGVDLSRVKFKKDAYNIIFEKAIEIEDIKASYEEYCRDNDLDPNGGFQTEFIDDYDDGECNTGLEGFLRNLINLKVDPSEEPFSYDDYCLFVAADIPCNDAAKAAMLTQEQIRTILCDYLNPLIEEPAVIEWLTIRG